MVYEDVQKGKLTAPGDQLDMQRMGDSVAKRDL